MPPSSKRSSKGRQKVPMRKMTNKSNLLVTFSKRRNGLFKKASQLCTLCGVQVALIVFSPGDKAFSFGHPSVDSLIHRFLGEMPPTLTHPMVEAHREANERGLNAELAELAEDLEVRRKHAEGINRARNEAQAQQRWWEAPVDEMSVPQLEQLKAALEKIKLSTVIDHSGHAIVPANSHFATPSFGGVPASSYYVPGPVPVPHMAGFHNTVLQNGQHLDGNNVMMNQMYYGGGYTGMLGGIGGGYGSHNHHGFN